MRVFSGIQATGAKHIGNYIGAMRQYVSTQDEGDAFFCIVDLHSITVDYDPQDLHDRTLDLAALLFAVGLEPGALHALPAEPRHRPRRGGLAALGRHRVRTTRPHDPVQGEGRRQGLRLRRPLHLPGADGGRHPALPDRHRPGRRRPAAAPRARARHRAAVQLALRRDVQGAGGRVPARSARGSWTCRSRRRRCRRPAATTQGKVLVLDPPDTIRKKFKTAVTDSGREIRYAPGREAGRLEPDRDPLRLHRHADPGRRARLRRPRLRRPEGRRRRGGRRALRADAGALRGAARRRGRAAAAAAGRRRQGARDVRSDAARDVRAHGVRRSRRIPRFVTRRKGLPCGECRLR